MRVAANLDTMFHECGGLSQRFEAAANAGFKAVEISMPYGVPIEQLKQLKEQFKLEVVQINSPSGNWDGGERGMACHPDKIEEFRNSIKVAIQYAKALQCPRIHVIAGMVPIQRVATEETYIQNLTYAAEQFATEGLTCLIEPLNKSTIPGYYLKSFEQAQRYLEAIALPNLKIQLDIFHVQQMCGQISATINALSPLIGHVQIAQVPDRHEPDSAGEISYDFVFQKLQEAGYTGFIGAEYIPKRKTVDGLGWIEKFGLTM